MTTASKPATTNAFAPYVLKTDTLFVREEEGWELDLLLSAGTTVRMRQVPTATGVDVIMRYADTDNNEWECVKKLPLPRPPQSAPPATVTTAATLVIAPPVASAQPPVQPAAPTAPVVPSAETKERQDRGNDRVLSHLAPVVSRQTRADESDDEDMRAAARLAKTEALLRDGFVSLTYFISDSVKRTTTNPAGVRNPCAILKRAGAVHLDGSNFAVPRKVMEDRKVKAALAELDATPNGEAWTLPVPYGREQIEAMRDKIRLQLEKKIQAIALRLIERIDNAAGKLREAQEALDATPKSSDKAEKMNTAAIRCAVKAACESFLMCLKGAEMFDDTGALDSLLDSSRRAIRAQATAVNATLRLRGVKIVAVSI